MKLLLLPFVLMVNIGWFLWGGIMWMRLRLRFRRKP